MMFAGKVRTIHFVGIGGIGMSGIAEVLLSLGFHVTGSDLSEGASVERLRGLGALVHVGHRPEHVGQANVVVRSTAVRDDNPEVAEALRLGVPVIARAEMLAELMRLKQGIAVAGTHGKTTTTSMLAACLVAGRLDPTVIIGGRLDRLGGSNARYGAGEYLVAEADESDGSFLFLSPTATIVTNIDPEHMDHYGSVEQLENTFVEFSNRVPFYGFSVMCLDHPRVQHLIPRVRRRVVTYGFARHADFRARAVEQRGIRTRFEVTRFGDALGTLELAMPGRHNVLNATAAVAAATEIGVSFDDVRGALDGFSGVQRRFTVVDEVDGVTIVDDYGHHPVEIQATLAAAEQACEDGRIIAVFQPHRYTRVRDLWDDFCASFNLAHEVVVCPIYAAGEAPIEGVTHDRLAREMWERGHRGTRAVADLDEAVEVARELARPGDLVVTLGAGNVNQVCGALAQALRARGVA